MTRLVFASLLFSTLLVGDGRTRHDLGGRPGDGGGLDHHEGPRASSRDRSPCSRIAVAASTIARTATQVRRRRR